jgi:YD repeat-containing protein
MNTVTYEPLIGITSQCDANNHILYYNYDGLSRLVNIKDDDGNIVKNFKYNYGLGATPAASSQTLFYNAGIQRDYTKTGCTNSTYGDVVTYKIPFGKYASSVSQPDANAKAAADTAANGQAYANSVGLCRWYNAYKHVKVFKNNCLPEQGYGGFVWYNIAIGTFKSLISQADADALAQADVTANGQAYANLYATCSCASEGHRFINGVCETGTLYHGSSVQQPDGTWECSYYYVFSDSYVTGFYYYYSSSPCPIDP